MHGDLVAVLGMFTGMLVSIGFIVGMIKIAQGPIGVALARRIQGRTAGDPDLQADVALLREQVDALQHQLDETLERVDFTERMLAQGRRADSLPEGH